MTFPSWEYIPVTCNKCGKSYTKRRGEVKRWSGFCKRCVPNQGHPSPFRGHTKETHPGVAKSAVKKEGKPRPDMRGENNYAWSGGRPTCFDCGIAISYGRKRCRPCANNSRRGPNHPMWRGGGYSEVSRVVRGSEEYQTWRKAVLHRDNYTCGLCKQRGGKLSAHHIKGFATHPELRFEVSNGITLCWPCHLSVNGKEAKYEAQFAWLVEFAA